MAIPGVVPLLAIAETDDGARALVLPRYDRSLRAGRGRHEVTDVGATRIGLALALFITVALVVSAWRSRRSPTDPSTTAN